MSFVVSCFPSHPPSPTQPVLMYGCRYTKLLRTIDVIGARPDDFLRMVTLNHATLWVGTILHVALENGHVSIKDTSDVRILDLVSLSHPRCDPRGVPSYRTRITKRPSRVGIIFLQSQY